MESEGIKLTNEVSAMRLTTVEEGKVQLPADWVVEMGLQTTVALRKTPDGILLVRPSATSLWDAVFAEKLTVSPHSIRPDETSNDEMSGDDFLL